MKAEKNQKAEPTKYTQLTVNQVCNGYTVHCSDLSAEDRRRGMHETAGQFVFNTAEALGKWIADNVQRP